MAAPTPMAASDSIVSGDRGGFVYLDAAALRSLIPASVLIPHLRTSISSLASSVVSPSRYHLPLGGGGGRGSAALLLMPAWSHHPSLPFIGLKAVTSFPGNAPLPSVHAAYLLFSSATGALLLALEGTALTLLRTSASSALAASLLAPPSPRTLVLVGAGALAPHLVAAHIAVHPTINKLILWNRSPEKTHSLANAIRETIAVGIHVECEVDLDAAVPAGDIVCCATGSGEVLVKGRLLKPGAHLNLVGSFTPEMRECDDEAMVRGRVFVDFKAAMEEAGELVGAFQRGAMRPEDVAGTLPELVAGTIPGRLNNEEVTVYKSVGDAVVDILAAQLAYNIYLQNQLLMSTWSKGLNATSIGYRI